jgi:hypothetical protein
MKQQISKSYQLLKATFILGGFIFLSLLKTYSQTNNEIYFEDFNINFEDGQLNGKNISISRLFSHNLKDTTYTISILDKRFPQKVYVSNEFIVNKEEYRYGYNSEISTSKYPSLAKGYYVYTVKPLSYFFNKEYKFDTLTSRIDMPILTVSKQGGFLSEQIERVVIAPVDYQTKKQQIKSERQKYLEDIVTCEDFQDGFAWVGYNIKYLIGEEPYAYWDGYRVYGLIDKNGKFVIEPQYVVYNKYGNKNDLHSPMYVDGFALVEPFDIDKAHNFIFIDKYGNNVFNKTFKSARNFSEGYAAVKADNGNWGFIDKTGHYICEPIYQSVGDFKNGLAKICIVEKNQMSEYGINYVREEYQDWGYIDSTGKEIIYPQFKHASDFSEGLAYIVSKTMTGFINKGGELAFSTPTKYCKLVAGFTNGIATFKFEDSENSDNYMYFNAKGRETLNRKRIGNYPVFRRVFNYSENLALAMDESSLKYGFIDKKQKWVINPTFDNAGSFSEGLARVKIKSNWGFVNQTGDIVINQDILKSDTEIRTKPNFDDASDFSEGFAVVRVRGKYGYIDTSENWLTQPIFDEALPFHNGFARVKFADNKGWKYIDKNGKTVF